MKTDKLSLTLPIGVAGNPDTKNVTLLRTNGIAERVFTSKNPSKPYTWMAEVITIGVGQLGSVSIGVNARMEKDKKDSITIPALVKALPLADANTLLVEIHRRVWQSNIPKQESTCKYCAKPMIFDIDLFKIEMGEEFQKRIDALEDFHNLEVALVEGFDFLPLKSISPGSASSYEEFENVNFNKFVFRAPTLGDAMNYERNSDDSVLMWRNIAFACLEKVQAVDEEGNVVYDLPKEVFRLYGLKLFNEFLYNEDLLAIRTALRESVPTLAFAYTDECPCAQKKTVPVSFEPSSFFTD